MIGEYKSITIVIKKEESLCRSSFYRCPQKKYGGESSVVSMRLPKDMLSAIDSAAAQTGRTRNEILTMSLEFALDHMKIEEKE